MEKSKPYLGQIALQVSYAGMNILARIALAEGMNHFVFVTYRQIIGAIVIAPLAYMTERKQRPPLTLAILFQIFLLGCGISVSQNCYFQGVYYTSSTFGSAAVNLIPVLTFVMATFLRMEKLDIKSVRGQTKMVGTIVCVTGAMVMTFYKGHEITIYSSSSQQTNHQKIMSENKNHRVVGSILIYGGIVAWSAWIAFQGLVIKRYPAHLSLTTLSCLIAAVQSAVVCFICEHDKLDVWATRSTVQIFSVLYAGILCSAIGFFIQGWCIQKKGPVFAGVFSPLCTVSTAFLEFIILHVPLHVGSVSGAILIIVGLYSALWGKAKDHTKQPEKMQGQDGDAQEINIHNSQHSIKESSGDDLPLNVSRVKKEVNNV